MGLTLGIWMKCFPVLFGIFLLFPIEHTPRENQRAQWRGLTWGGVLGVILPLYFWRDSLSFEIFIAWFKVLMQDLHFPHLKIGLAALLPVSLRGHLFVGQILFFGLLLPWVVMQHFKYKSSGVNSEALIGRITLESILLTGILILSHMTEPPTLALLAPVIVWIWSKGSIVELSALSLFLFLLPSDLTPQSLKQIFGGQYMIKSWTLLLILTILTRQAFRPPKKLAG